MNWAQLIIEIQDAAGLSQAAIGVELGKTQGWVSAVLAGQYGDLKWGDGQALIALHTTHVPVGADATPSALVQEAA